MERTYPEFLKRYLPEERINRENLQLLNYDGVDYIRLKRDASGFLRGTVFIKGMVIRGFQRIKRILSLEEGIKRYIKGAFYLEEKMDGYNIRVRRIGDRLFTFTRGGFVCPFTMDRVEEFIDPDFFSEHPHYTLCAEVVGPENPYNSEPVDFIKEDIEFFVFDIKGPDGKSLPLEQRYALYERTGLRAVRRWGPFQAGDIETVRNIVVELDRNQREGIVIKSVSGDEELKYVTASSCIRDIRATAHLITEIPAGFYIQRILRLSMIAREFGLKLEEPLFADTGRAFLEPLSESLEEVAGGERIKEFFRIRVNKRETIERLLLHLKKMGISAKVVSIERRADKYAVTFYRSFPRGSRTLRRALRGYGIYD